MPAPPIVIPHAIREKLQRGLAQDKIIFLSAGPGWGKTSVVTKLLEKHNAVYLSLRKRPLPHRFSREQLIILDDFQVLQPQGEEQFRELLRRSPGKQRFVLLSRASLPEYFSLFQVTGALLQLNTGDLALDQDCLSQLARAYGVRLSLHELRRFWMETSGCPAASVFLLCALSSGQPLQQQAVDTMAAKMGAYLEETALRLLDQKRQQLLTELSLFDRFDQRLAELLTGDQAGLALLESLCRDGWLTRYGGTWRIADERFVRPLLRQKLRAQCPPERLRAVHLAAGRWYFTRQDFRSALYHYRQADGWNNICGLLTEYIRLHPGIEAWRSLQDCFDLLTEEELRSSPDLMCAMSMLCSASLKTEESEQWYRALVEYVRSADPHSDSYPHLRGLPFYLDLCLPHRRAEELCHVIPAAARLLRSNTMILPEISVTGELPSLLRGGRDFSQWTLIKPALLRPMFACAERMLDRSGLGLKEIAAAERLLEQGADISGRLPALSALQAELKIRGAREMEFVLTALLVRTLCAAGRRADAQALLLQFRSEIEQRGGPAGIAANIDAMHCRLSLMGEGAYAAAWNAGQPSDGGNILWTESYRCLTKARCCIKEGAHHTALLLLSRILDYARRHRRPLDMLEALILIAICRFRMRCADWQTHLSHAFALGLRYRYTAVFSREGAALLPLLQSFDHSSIAPAYWEQILEGTVIQAGYYGRYLQPLNSPHLTRKELMVLRLVSQNKTNAEISSLMNIKLPTVKTHLYSLYKKLEITNRGAAGEAARQLGLI